MAGIPTSNILKPGGISVGDNGITRALISDLQLLTPEYYKGYVEKYGNEAFFMWLATYAGMEVVKQREFFWYENRGKLMLAISPAANVSAAVNGGTITIVVSTTDHFTSTTCPIREKESIRISSTHVEGEILTVTINPNAIEFTARPKRSDKTLASAGATSLLATDVVCLIGQVDAGEASDSIDTQTHLDEKITNTTTEIRDTFTATDRAEMTEIWYSEGVSGSVPNGGDLAGTSFYTLKGCKKWNQRYLNNMEGKLMFGDIVTNSGLNTTTSVGTQGFVPKVLEDGELVGITPGDLSIPKMHEITRIMDVNGCAKTNMWIMDTYLRQNLTDGIFKEFPAGSYVWGEKEASEEAVINYGVEKLKIDDYMFLPKKLRMFNTEAVYGKTPASDRTRGFGVLCPLGGTTDFAADGDRNSIKNITVMMENPVGGGTTGNGIRVWRHGGGSKNPTNGKMVDNIEMIAYRGIRVAAANQFVVTQYA